MIKLLKLGYRNIEVPVSKIYPSKGLGNTKMRPLVDWWHILSPISLIGLALEGVKRNGAAQRRRP